MALAFRISSLAALTAAVLSPLAAYMLGCLSLIIPIALLAALIWFTHRANIKRLLSGTEPTINLGARS
jgi:glycerol-3-phosphate acyltransferase PlsY